MSGAVPNPPSLSALAVATSPPSAHERAAPMSESNLFFPPNLLVAGVDMAG
jgi:hypothetical protein